MILLQHSSRSAEEDGTVLHAVDVDGYSFPFLRIDIARLNVEQ